MRVLLKALGASVLIAGIKRIRHDINEANRRKSIVCRFDEEISRDDFREMVEQSGKGIERIISLHAEDARVNGIVRSQSGISEWRFKIDFNDYGKLSGKYWIYSDNEDSRIPKVIADRISQKIAGYLGCEDDIDEAELNRKKTKPIESSSYCPYCGKQNRKENAKSCMYCGLRFRV